MSSKILKIFVKLLMAVILFMGALVYAGSARQPQNHLEALEFLGLLDRLTELQSKQEEEAFSIISERRKELLHGTHHKLESQNQNVEFLKEVNLAFELLRELRNRGLLVRTLNSEPSGLFEWLEDLFADLSQYTSQGRERRWTSSPQPTASTSVVISEARLFEFDQVFENQDGWIFYGKSPQSRFSEWWWSPKNGGFASRLWPMFGGGSSSGTRWHYDWIRMDVMNPQSLRGFDTMRIHADSPGVLIYADIEFRKITGRTSLSPEEQVKFNRMITPMTKTNILYNEFSKTKWRDYGFHFFDMEDSYLVVIEGVPMSSVELSDSYKDIRAVRVDKATLATDEFSVKYDQRQRQYFMAETGLILSLAGEAESGKGEFPVFDPVSKRYYGHVVQPKRYQDRSQSVRFRDGDKVISEFPAVPLEVIRKMDIVKTLNEYLSAPPEFETPSNYMWRARSEDGPGVAISACQSMLLGRPKPKSQGNLPANL